MGWAARLSPEAKAEAQSGEFRRLARFITNEAELSVFLSRFADRRLRAAVRALILPDLPFTPTAAVTIPAEQQYV